MFGLLVFDVLGRGDAVSEVGSILQGIFLFLLYFPCLIQMNQDWFGGGAGHNGGFPVRVLFGTLSIYTNL